MAILLKSGGLFLHVPKTGGNWVSAVLEARGLAFAHLGGKHAGLQQLGAFDRLLHVPSRYDKPNRPLFAFCFVRHPVRWYESWFKMNARLGWPEWPDDEDAWNPSVELNGLAAPTFDGFVARVLDRRPGFLTHLYAHYDRGVHFVGRQECIANDLLRVLTFLRTSVTAADLRRHEPVNVSPSGSLPLTSSLLTALERAERGAFDRYGYSCDEHGGPDAGYDPFRIPRRARLTAPFEHDGGLAWRVRQEELSRFADCLEHPHQSILAILENGTPLAEAHARHDEIRAHGRGRFSHWADALRFSTSDNSDPNRNGRIYEAVWVFPGPADSTQLLAEPLASLFGVSQ